MKHLLMYPDLGITSTSPTGTISWSISCRVWPNILDASPLPYRLLTVARIVGQSGTDLSSSVACSRVSERLRDTRHSRGMVDRTSSLLSPFRSGFRSSQCLSILHNGTERVWQQRRAARMEHRVTVRTDGDEIAAWVDHSSLSDD